MLNICCSVTLLLQELLRLEVGELRKELDASEDELQSARQEAQSASERVSRQPGAVYTHVLSWLCNASHCYRACMLTKLFGAGLAA